MPVGSGAAATSPGRGRPRSETVAAEILSATLDLVRDVGINALSMDDLASRAGVSKATIYRRWSSKETLVIDALRSVITPFDEIDTGSLRDDLGLYLGELAERFSSQSGLDILPHLLEVSAHDEAVRASLDDYVHNRRRPLLAIFENARDRGELAPDLDVDVMVDAIIGPFVYRRLLSHDPIDADFVGRLLAVVLPA